LIYCFVYGDRKSFFELKIRTERVLELLEEYKKEYKIFDSYSWYKFLKNKDIEVEVLKIEPDVLIKVI